MGRAPRRNLPPAAEQWGRYVERRLDEIERLTGTTKRQVGATARRTSVSFQENANQHVQVVEVEEEVKTKTGTYWQDTPPSPEDYRLRANDQWYNTAEDSRLYLWVPVDDPELGPGQWVPEDAFDEAPPVPDAPTVTGRAGSLLVEWDGSWVGSPPSSEQARANTIEVWVSEDPLWDDTEAPDVEKVGEFPAKSTGGWAVVALGEGTYYARLVSVSRKGKRSQPSPVESGEVTAIIGTDFVDDLTERIDEADKAIANARITAGLLDNPGFIPDESGTWGPGWELDPTYGGSAEFVQPEDLSDANAISVTSTGTFAAVWNTRTIAVTPGEEIHLSAWGQGSSVGFIMGVYRDRDGNALATSPFVYLTSSTDWQKTEGSWTVPADATTLQIAAGVSGPGQTKTIARVTANRMVDTDLIVPGAVTAEKITASEEMWTKVLGAHKIMSAEIDVDDLAANSAFIAELDSAIVRSDMFEGREFIGGMFTGTTFRTAVSGQRVVMDQANGLRAYNADEDQVMGFDSSTGDMFLRGLITQSNSIGDFILGTEEWGSDTTPGIRWERADANLPGAPAGIAYSHMGASDPTVRGLAGLAVYGPQTEIQQGANVWHQRSTLLLDEEGGSFLASEQVTPEWASIREVRYAHSLSLSPTRWELSGRGAVFPYDSTAGNVISRELDGNVKIQFWPSMDERVGDARTEAIFGPQRIDFFARSTDSARPGVINLNSARDVTATAGRTLTLSGQNGINVTSSGGDVSLIGDHAFLNGRTGFTVGTTAGSSRYIHAPDGSADLQLVSASGELGGWGNTVYLATNDNATGLSLESTRATLGTTGALIDASAGSVEITATNSASLVVGGVSLSLPSAGDFNLRRTSDNARFALAGTQMVMNNGNHEVRLRDVNGGETFITSLITRTTTSAANLFVSSTTGTLGAFNVCPQAQDRPSANRARSAEASLDITPQHWIDKPAADALAAWVDGDDDADIEGLRRHDHRVPGFIAEDFHDAGLTEFVEYNDEGEVEGLAYDRIPALHHVLLQHQREQISELRARVEALENAS